MTNTKSIHNELEQRVFEAVQSGLVKPQEVLAYVLDNGWNHEKPSKVTIISLLNKNNIHYVWGRWERAE